MPVDEEDESRVNRWGFPHAKPVFEMAVWMLEQGVDASCGFEFAGVVGE